jgi:hypothetical protein
MPSSRPGWSGEDVSSVSSSPGESRCRSPPGPGALEGQPLVRCPAGVAFTTSLPPTGLALPRRAAAPTIWPRFSFWREGGSEPRARTSCLRSQSRAGRPVAPPGDPPGGLPDPALAWAALDAVVADDAAVPARDAPPPSARERPRDHGGMRPAPPVGAGRVEERIAARSGSATIGARVPSKSRASNVLERANCSSTVRLARARISRITPRRRPTPEAVG